MASAHLNKIRIFSSFSMFIGVLILERTSAANIDHDLDGELFIEQIIHGEKTTKPNSGRYVFTAPYRLCEGGCAPNSNNNVMNFPLYVGDAGRQMYKKMFERDFNKKFDGKSDAPFTQKASTMSRMKPCITYSTTTKKPPTVTTTIEPRTADISTSTTELLTTTDVTIEPSTIPEPATTTKEPSTTTKEPRIPTKEPTTVTLPPTAIHLRCPKLKPRKCKNKHKRTPKIVRSRDYSDSFFYNVKDKTNTDSIALESLYFED